MRVARIPSSEGGNIFAMSSHADEERGRTEKYSEIKHVFVPHIASMELPVPNMSSLISMPRRFHLKSIDDATYQKDRFGAYNAEIDAVGARMQEAGTGLVGRNALDTAASSSESDPAPILDLGIANLQRIVTNMKGISFDTNRYV
jgi:hypothetical protein